METASHYTNSYEAPAQEKLAFLKKKKKMYG